MLLRPMLRSARGVGARRLTEIGPVQSERSWNVEQVTEQAGDFCLCAGRRAVGRLS